MPDKNQYFYIIPAELLEKGKTAEALLYGIIYSYSKAKGFCWPSNKCLAKKLNRSSISKISRHVKNLCDSAWIRVEYGGNNFRKIFPLVELKSLPSGARGLPSRARLIALKGKGAYPQGQHSSTISSINSSINKKVLEIIEFWNKHKLPKCEKITAHRIKIIEKVLTQHSGEEIKSAIKHYDDAINEPDYFENYKWSLELFLSRQRGYTSWLKDGEKWQSYLTWYNNPDQQKKRGD